MTTPKLISIILTTSILTWYITTLRADQIELKVYREASDVRIERDALRIRYGVCLEGIGYTEVLKRLGLVNYKGGGK